MLKQTGLVFLAVCVILGASQNATTNSTQWPQQQQPLCCPQAPGVTCSQCNAQGLICCYNVPPNWSQPCDPNCPLPCCGPNSGSSPCDPNCKASSPPPTSPSPNGGLEGLQCTSCVNQLLTCDQDPVCRVQYQMWANAAMNVSAPSNVTGLEMLIRQMCVDAGLAQCPVQLINANGTMGWFPCVRDRCLSNPQNMTGGFDMCFQQQCMRETLDCYLEGTGQCFGLVTYIGNYYDAYTSFPVVTNPSPKLVAAKNCLLSGCFRQLVGSSRADYGDLCPACIPKLRQCFAPGNRCFDEFYRFITIASNNSNSNNGPPPGPTYPPYYNGTYPPYNGTYPPYNGTYPPYNGTYPPYNGSATYPPGNFTFTTTMPNFIINYMPPNRSYFINERTAFCQNPPSGVGGCGPRFQNLSTCAIDQCFLTGRNSINDNHGPGACESVFCNAEYSSCFGNGNANLCGLDYKNFYIYVTRRFILDRFAQYNLCQMYNLTCATTPSVPEILACLTSECPADFNTPVCPAASRLSCSAPLMYWNFLAQGGPQTRDFEFRLDAPYTPDYVSIYQRCDGRNDCPPFSLYNKTDNRKAGYLQNMYADEIGCNYTHPQVYDQQCPMCSAYLENCFLTPGCGQDLNAIMMSMGTIQNSFVSIAGYLVPYFFDFCAQTLACTPAAINLFGCIANNPNTCPLGNNNGGFGCAACQNEFTACLCEPGCMNVFSNSGVFEVILPLAAADLNLQNGVISSDTKCFVRTYMQCKVKNCVGPAARQQLQYYLNNPQAGAPFMNQVCGPQDVCKNNCTAHLDACCKDPACLPSFANLMASSSNNNGPPIQNVPTSFFYSTFSTVCPRKYDPAYRNATLPPGCSNYNWVNYWQCLSRTCLERNATFECFDCNCKAEEMACKNDTACDNFLNNQIITTFYSKISQGGYLCGTPGTACPQQLTDYMMCESGCSSLPQYYNPLPPMCGPGGGGNYTGGNFTNSTIGGNMGGSNSGGGGGGGGGNSTCVNGTRYQPVPIRQDSYDIPNAPVAIGVCTKYDVTFTVGDATTLCNDLNFWHALSVYWQSLCFERGIDVAYVGFRCSAQPLAGCADLGTIPSGQGTQGVYFRANLWLSDRAQQTVLDVLTFVVDTIKAGGLNPINESLVGSEMILKSQGALGSANWIGTQLSCQAGQWNQAQATQFCNAAFNLIKAANPTPQPTANPVTTSPSVSPSRGPTVTGQTWSPSTNPTAHPVTSKPTSNPSTSTPTRGPTRPGATFGPTTNPTTSNPTKSPTTSGPTSSPVVRSVLIGDAPPKGRLSYILVALCVAVFTLWM